MGIETERKFLVSDDSWRPEAVNSEDIRQAYLANTTRSSIRIRTMGETANINIKQMLVGPSRTEYEYAIPVNEANELLDSLCEPVEIQKTRYFVPIGPHTWEIDVFSGANSGLVVAEIELQSIEEEFSKPGWLGPEVTDDVRYYNVALASKPWSEWGK